jgi:hypothetical protein
MGRVAGIRNEHEMVKELEGLEDDFAVAKV